jgi:spore coat protein CotH
LATAVVALAASSGCSSSHQPGGGLATGLTCSDLFDQNVVRTYSVDIAPDVWQSLEAEFHDLASLQAGLDFAAYHPVVVHLDQETVANASIRLHGQSSWLQTVMYDGDRAKMQFDVAFDKVDEGAKFHGVDKLVFDMPRSDWTFLHDRLAHAWLRENGIMAGCAASARLEINGAYYGLYVVEEDVGKSVIKQFFPDHPDGDLWKAGQQAETNKGSVDAARTQAFWAAGDLAAVSAIVDLDGSVRSWAAEAMLNDADGYYGGFHNFYLYDEGQKGLVFLPVDTDATFDWLAIFDLPGALDHPVFWWQGRAQPAPPPGPHWSIVMADAGWRRKYADAMAALLDHWDVAQIQGWIDAWSQQIAGDVAADPHSWAGADDFNMAVAQARSIVSARADYLRSFVSCEQNGDGADADGDGARWCDDCRDDDASIHVGTPELCNGVDDNCNGIVDEGC